MSWSSPIGKGTRFVRKDHRRVGEDRDRVQNGVTHCRLATKRVRDSEKVLLRHHSRVDIPGVRLGKGILSPEDKILDVEIVSF